jgi:predicted RNase H-like HicB family nuclease
MSWEAGDPLPRYHYRFHQPVRDEDGRIVYYVDYVELSGCAAQGSTRSEALANLAQLLPDYLRQLVRFNQPVPPAQPEGDVKVGAYEMLIGPWDKMIVVVAKGAIEVPVHQDARMTDESTAQTFSAGLPVGA